jgi:uncharacterized protein with FMN-binding domain
MRRITMWVVSTVAALVLLFSYRTSTSGATGTSTAGHAANAPGVVTGPSLDAVPGPTDSTAPAPSAGSGTPVPSPKSTTAKNQVTVVNGSVAQTRWGPVQVQVRISGGKIVEISTLQVPNGNGRDQEINSYAVPQLRQQVLTAQSATIDGVSGATVTSDGYRESLQAALDAAHFKG